MTKEEAIKVLEYIRQWTDYPKEALTMAIEALSKPGLPAELDDASSEEADELLSYMKVNAGMISTSTAKALMMASARFGAEWMAGQFQKIDGSLDGWYSTSDGKDYCYGIRTNESFEVPEGFYIKKK